MALILLACVVVATSAAPQVSEGLYGDWQKEMFDRMDLNRLQELYPAKRSNYGNYYATPCAAAAAASAYAPAIATAPGYPAPAATPYSYGHAAYHPVPAHQGYPPAHYGHPYYRSQDELENEQESMGFSDMNHVAFEHAPMARSYGPPAVQVGGGYGAEQAASGPVVGVFSNAKVEGCSVPLLVTCSPSIAHGRIVKTQPYYDSSAYPSQQDYSYRGVDDQSHHHEPEMHQEKAAHSSSELLPHNSKSIVDKHQ